MMEITLTRGLVARIDDADYALVSAYKWRARASRGTFYADASLPRQGGKSNPAISMHRLILGFPESMVDHADNDGLNNQRYNLRPATNSQNQANKRKPYGKSQFKGVYWYRGRWIARVMKDQKSYFLGWFHDEVDAATAYNFKALELFGEFSKINVLPEKTNAA